MGKLKIILYIFLINQITLMVISMFTMYKYHLHLQEYSHKMSELHQLIAELYEITKKSESQINILSQPPNIFVSLFDFSCKAWAFCTFGPLSQLFMKNLTSWLSGQQ